MSSFKDRFAELLKALNVNKGTFAAKYKISPQAVYNMLAGQTTPSYDTLAKMCEITPEISTEYLIKGVGEPLIEQKPADKGEMLDLLFEVKSNFDRYVEDKVKSLAGARPLSPNLFIEIKKRQSDNQYYFTLLSFGGQQLLSSEGYNTKQACVAGLNTFKKLAKLESSYLRIDQPNHYRFSIATDNFEIIARSSESYYSRDSRDGVIRSIIALAESAIINDSTN